MPCSGPPPSEGRIAPVPSSGAAEFERWLVDAGPAIDAAIEDAAGSVTAPRLAEILDRWADVLEDRGTGGFARLAAVQSALSQLRSVTDLATLFDRVVHLAVDALGFDRASISRVDGSSWRVERAHFPATPDLAARFLAVSATDPPRLDHMIVESELVRRGCPCS